LAAKIHVVGTRRVESVAGELHVGRGEPPFSTHVSRKRDPIPVRKGAALAVDVHGNAGVARGPDAKHFDSLEIRPAVARRPHAPGSQMIFDIRRGEADARAIYSPSLKLI